jgi:hypothetical protein
MNSPDSKAFVVQIVDNLYAHKTDNETLWVRSAYLFGLKYIILVANICPVAVCTMATHYITPGINIGIGGYLARRVVFTQRYTSSTYYTGRHRTVVSRGYCRLSLSFEIMVRFTFLENNIREDISNCSLCRTIVHGSYDFCIFIWTACTRAKINRTSSLPSASVTVRGYISNIKTNLLTFAVRCCVVATRHV